MITTEMAQTIRDEISTLRLLINQDIFSQSEIFDAIDRIERIVSETEQANNEAKERLKELNDLLDIIGEKVY